MSYLEYKERYIKFAGTISINNEVMNSGMFLSGVGACFHKYGIGVRFAKRIDLRIHTMFEQASRTGKGESVDVLRQFAEWMGLDVIEQVVFTDAALVGTIDGKLQQENRAKGLVMGMDDFKDPRVIGSLGLNDLIIFPEAIQMFKKGAHTEDLREILQSAMDSSGKVEKDLSGEYRLSYKSPATIIGTTYKLEEFEEILLKQGLFQRLLVFIRDYPIEERSNLNAEIIKSSRIESTTDDAQENLKILAEQIKQIAKENEGKLYRLSQTGEKLFLRYNKEKIKYIKNNFSGTDLELVGPFTTSILNIHLKLAGIAAVLNGVDEIGADELKQTRPETDYYFKSIVTKMLNRVSSSSPDQVRKEILDYIRGLKPDKNGDHIANKDKLYQHMIDKLHVTDNFVKSVVLSMKSNQEIDVDNKTKQIKKLKRR